MKPLKYQTPESYKDARKSLGMTRPEFANLVGSSVKTIYNRETGAVQISKESAITVSVVLKNHKKE